MIYRFSELTEKAQIKAVKSYKQFKKYTENKELTDCAARTIIFTLDDCIPFSASGICYFASEIEGFYIREVPALGAMHFYYFFEKRLMALDKSLDDKIDWYGSIHTLPFKSLGFKQVNL